jgi:hypothetical protein
MAHNFIQVPPDSTGKKIRHTKRYDIEVSNVLVDLNLLERGQSVLGQTSGAVGQFINFAVELGEIYIFVKADGIDFLVGEQLIINGSDTATVDNFAVQHTSNVIISDPDKPSNRLRVDDNGSAYTRFSEGDQRFDAFGNAQFSQVTQIDHHMYTYGDRPTYYWDDIQGTAYVTASIQDSSLILAVDNQSGSRVSRTSHQYYPYNPGDGNIIELSVLSGDEGKAGVIRRWGLYDDLDGIFFELDGTSWNVGQRSSTTGVAVDTIINQVDFNGDSLDDINTSEYLIEFSTYNLYWIDFQWLGVGKVRMGTYSPTGTRVTVHTFKHPNTNTSPYMKRGTLPFKMEIFNDTATASSSELKSVCTTIARQSDKTTFPGEYETYISELRSITESTPKVIASAKPALLYNGVVNRTTVIPTAFEVNVTGNPVRIDVIVNGFVSGSTYVANTDADSSTLIDDVGTTIVGGTRMESIMCGVGVTHRVLEEKLYNSLKLSADGVSQPIFSLVANVMAATGSADVNMIIRWKESR